MVQKRSARNGQRTVVVIVLSLAAVLLLVGIFLGTRGKVVGKAVDGAETNNCADGEDNDNDDLIDCFDPACNSDSNGDGELNCFDSACLTDQQCRGESCGLNKIVTWSYKLPAEENELAQGMAPDLVGCCKESQCAVSDGCQNIVSLSEEATLVDYLCEQEQNWVECNAENEGAVSSDGLYECVDSSDTDIEWEVICQPATKYKLRSTDDDGQNEELCDGQQWQQADCATFGAYPTIVDPTVKIRCQSGGWQINELVCNNNRDDDNDGKTDRDDGDCETVTRTLGKDAGEWYEIDIKSTDDYKTTIQPG